MSKYTLFLPKVIHSGKGYTPREAAGIVVIVAGFGGNMQKEVMSMSG